MKALINVDYSKVYRVGGCGFNEDVYSVKNLGALDIKV